MGPNHTKCGLADLPDAAPVARLVATYSRASAVVRPLLWQRSNWSQAPALPFEPTPRPIGKGRIQQSMSGYARAEFERFCPSISPTRSGAKGRCTSRQNHGQRPSKIFQASTSCASCGGSVGIGLLSLQGRQLNLVLRLWWYSKFQIGGRGPPG